MNNLEIQRKRTFIKEVLIEALPLAVWDALVIPDLMKQWMFDSALTIDAEWRPGGAVVISGDMHGSYFENNGFVLRFEPERFLAYSHLSSLSHLADEPVNYSVLEFCLTEIAGQTRLILTMHNFPTEEIYRHLAFYWLVTMEILKKFIEARSAESAT